ncbi:flavin reductase family protein [Bosea sp. LjRoot9]|uniref:flavin reductase n=1 Tax=Bosea sp. LjRoot9 TaxID=3342341 RepID=UPI003ECCF945
MRTPVESGDPRIEPAGFRRSLGEFATGVTVITTSLGGISYGMTSNSFASVSLEPPLVLWSIRRESTSYAAFESCSHFAVHILADNQIDLSQRFARSGADKFSGLDCQAGLGEAPLLDHVAARFECSRSQAYDGGDHLILLGEVQRYCRYDRPPLLFAKGRYAVAADHPETRVFDIAGIVPGQDGGEERVLSNLMIRAYSTVAARLETGRKSAGLGLTLMQARLLRAAATSPDKTLEDLLPELLLDFNASQNLLSSMIALGLVAVDGEARMRLTGAGEESLKAIIAHARANEELLFQGIPEDDLATVRRVLAGIVSSQTGGPARATA